MDIITTAEGWHFLLRWLHFLAGITWIGVLYYFNFVQTPFFGTELGGTARSAMIRGLVPNALWWFRWGAMFTFLTGWTIVMGRARTRASALGDGYMTRILTGGIMGTFMWANVWFVIWPAQQVVIKSAETGRRRRRGDPGSSGPRRARRSRVAHQHALLDPDALLHGLGDALHRARQRHGRRRLLGVRADRDGRDRGERFFGTPASQKLLSTVGGTIHAGVLVAIVLYALMEIIL